MRADTAAAQDTTQHLAHGGVPPSGKSATACPTTTSSVFGQARPREEVLRERGVLDVADLPDARAGAGASFGGGKAPDHHHHSYVVPGTRGSRAASVASGYSDEHRVGDQSSSWQTVGGAKRRNGGGGAEHGGGGGPLLADDPLLGAFGHGPTRFFDAGGREGGYRPPFGGERDYGSFQRREEPPPVDDGVTIRRALPLRNSEF